MKKICSHVLLLSSMVAPAFAGTLTFLTTPGAAIDTVNWSSLGTDGTTFANGATAVSGLGKIATIGLGTQPALGGLTSVVCPVVNPTNCSWGHQASGFSDGDTLIWLEGLDVNSNPVGTGPLTLSLSSGVGGLGTYLQTASSGAFAAQLKVYNGASLLGTRAYSSNGAGAPLFVGVLDDVAGEINKAVLTVTSCGGFACDANDFSVDRLQIYAANGSATTPEPATFALGATILALGFGLKKRFERGNK